MVCCAVIGCSNKTQFTLGVSYFRFPSVHGPDKKISSIREKRREAWKKALRRKDLTDLKMKYERVCSNHFVSGKPGKLEEVDDVDWAPSINLGYSSSAKPHLYNERRKRRINRQKRMMNLTSLRNRSSGGKVIENYSHSQVHVDSKSGKKNSNLCPSQLKDCGRVVLLSLDCPYCFNRFREKTLWASHVKSCVNKHTQDENIFDISLTDNFSVYSETEVAESVDDNQCEEMLNDNLYLICEFCNDLFHSVDDYNHHVNHGRCLKSGNHKNKKYNVSTSDPKTSSVNDNSFNSDTCSLSGKEEMEDSLQDENLSSQLNSESELNVFNEQNVNLFTCKICDLKFTERLSFILHKDKHLNLEVNDSSSTLKDHSSITPSKKVFICCEICGEKFKSNKECSDHFKIHNTNKCNVCSKEFPSDLKLKEHNVIHVAHVKSNQCEFCLLRFSHEEGLESHLSDAHKDLKILRNCPLCEKRCASSSAVKNHVLKCHLIPVLQQEIRENYALGSDLMDNMKSVGVVTSEEVNIVTEFQTRMKSPPILMCDTCGFTSKKRNEMIEHSQGHLLNLIGCSLCEQRVSDDDELRTHMFNVHGIKFHELSCPHCLLDFDDLKIHLIEEHSSIYSNFACKICGELYLNKKSLSVHVKKAHLNQSDSFQQFEVVDSSDFYDSNEVILTYDEDNELSAALKTIRNDIEDPSTRLNCDICHLEFSKDDFEEHLKVHFSNCNICNKQYQSKSELLSHLNKHSKESQDIPCSVCSDKFHDKIHLREHMLVAHVDESQSYCCLCERNFTHKSHYLKHWNLEHSIDKTCNICDEHFTSLNLYALHKEYAHRTNLACNFCPKVCKNIKQLKNHEGIHKKYDGKVFNCNECPKQFKTPSGLKFHTMSHTGKYPYVCEFCGRGFASFYGLSEHRASHTGDVRYCCDICGKSFRLYDTYHRHRRQHDNPYPAKCNDCGKRFRNASRVAEHRRKTHTGERPYCCPYCPMTFNVSSSYRSHLCIHTKVFPYNCTICSRGFTTRMKYGNHLASKHDDFSIICNKNPNYKKLVPIENDVNAL